MTKRIVVFVSVMCSGLILASFIPRNDKPKTKTIRTIIVDAGHGIMDNGGHNGAKGSYSYEDEICLDVSKKLVAELHKQLPDIKVVESRPTNKIVPLHRRAQIANENKGDLFICIHVNAAVPIRHSQMTGYKTVTSYIGKGRKKKKVTRKVPQYKYWSTPNPAKGTETYIWGAHKNEDKEVAMRENAEMMEESDFKDVYGDIDPNSPEFIALSLLKTKQYFKRSATIANFVQDELSQIGRVDRDVRQRGVGIWVLQATAMPSILVETGYITNREEEDYLNSDAGQKEISECITRAVKTYIAWLEKQQNNIDTSDNTQNDNNKNQTPPREKEAKAILSAVEQKEKNTKTPEKKAF